MQADVDNILEMRRYKPETAPVELAEDKVLFTLFTAPTAPPEPREHSKRHHSIRTTNGEDARKWKKEMKDLEAARRASMIDGLTCQMRDRELAARASGSRLDVIERSTTEGVITTKDASFEKLDTPAC